MRANSTYGMMNSPDLVEIKGTRTRCHYCNQYSNRKIKYMEKGEKAIVIAVNAGPTGLVYICQKHAQKMSEEIHELLKEWN